MKKFFRNLFGAARSAQIEVMYFGRPSEFLMMTSERIEISDDIGTLGKMLDALRQRGNVWAYELDQQYLCCTINRKAAQWSDTLRAGDEVGIFSSKSSFAAIQEH